LIERTETHFLVGERRWNTFLVIGSIERTETIDHANASTIEHAS